MQCSVAVTPFYIHVFFALQESERLVNAEDKLMKLQVDRDKFETQLTVRFKFQCVCLVDKNSMSLRTMHKKVLSNQCKVLF